jgi:hypothetical protein
MTYPYEHNPCGKLSGSGHLSRQAFVPFAPREPHPPRLQLEPLGSSSRNHRTRREWWPSQIRILSVNAFYVLPTKGCEDGSFTIFVLVALPLARTTCCKFAMYLQQSCSSFGEHARYRRLGQADFMLRPCLLCVIDRKAGRSRRLSDKGIAMIAFSSWCITNNRDANNGACNSGGNTDANNGACNSGGNTDANNGDGANNAFDNNRPFRRRLWGLVLPGSAQLAPR